MRIIKKKQERQGKKWRVKWCWTVTKNCTYKVNWTLYLRQSISARSHYLFALSLRVHSKLVGNKPALYSRSMRSIFFQYRVCCQNMQAAAMKNSKQAHEANARASVCQSSSIISTSDFSMTRKLWLLAELWDYSEMKENRGKIELNIILFCFAFHLIWFQAHRMIIANELHLMCERWAVLTRCCFGSPIAVNQFKSYSRSLSVPQTTSWCGWHDLSTIDWSSHTVHRMQSSRSWSHQ